ncbi:hypothetical protein [Ancylobacter defluvii]|uniref:Uncharacterized protein n=1 Tax=Ancylobacter defluvii TaxID=1282440 RepID=A0A9W6NB78_9HYPH|nr:hypothetical protein [Ancylobacter defluvii]MBS7585933.1 hypothetical protein [Ancylobacter defluvii]GLK84310.1 hypothetical protein GCM10017653_23800 [Ancylobacter defluvii]
MQNRPAIGAIVQPHRLKPASSTHSTMTGARSVPAPRRAVASIEAMPGNRPAFAMIDEALFEIVPACDTDKAAIAA